MRGGKAELAAMGPTSPEPNAAASGVPVRGRTRAIKLGPGYEWCCGVDGCMAA